jgi:hypothetical protein
MINELGLKGNALAVYAIIYGFSQDGETRYNGSSRYLSEWLGCSKKTILTTLSSLVEAGLLKKRAFNQNGVTFCNYVALRTPEPPQEDDVDEITPPVKILHQGGEEITPGWCKNYSDPEKNLHQGGVKITPNNKDYNTSNNSNNNTSNNKNNNTRAREEQEPVAPPKPKAKPKKKKADNPDKPEKHQHGEFKNVLLTDEELKKLQDKFPADWKRRIDDLSFGIKSKGYKYSSHYATILAWDRNDKKRAEKNRKPQTATGPNGIAIDPTMTDLDGAFR